MEIFDGHHDDVLQTFSAVLMMPVGIGGVRITQASVLSVHSSKLGGGKDQHSKNLEQCIRH